MSQAEASVRRRAGPRSPAAQRPLSDQLETVFQGIADLTSLVGLLSEQADGIARELAQVHDLAKRLDPATADGRGARDGNGSSPTRQIRIIR